MIVHGPRRDGANVAAGGLMSYGTDVIEQYREAASYVDRILRGANPADVLVQAPTKYQTVPNLKTAKSLSLEASARTYRELKARASATPGIEFVALRYGFFYGPGTWYTREGDMGEQVRQQKVPIIGEGQGVYSFVHIDDAAGATAAALECPPGAYNIVDGNPSPQHLWLTAFARATGAPAPPRISEEEALRASGPDAVYYATRLRGASNEKAGRELEFRPRSLEWI
jgi:nucleoside-diphosphate-sugar epimerase